MFQGTSNSEDHERRGLILAGDYILGSVIGRGTSAVVHQAWQRETGAFVAIKKFEFGSNNVKTVLTELELLSKLDHPNIVKYLGAITGDEGNLHVVLEYMENGSLVTWAYRTHTQCWHRLRFANSLGIFRSQSAALTSGRLVSDLK